MKLKEYKNNEETLEDRVGSQNQCIGEKLYILFTFKGKNHVKKSNNKIKTQRPEEK